MSEWNQEADLPVMAGDDEEAVQAEPAPEPPPPPVALVPTVEVGAAAAGTTATNPQTLYKQFADIRKGIIREMVAQGWIPGKRGFNVEAQRRMDAHDPPIPYSHASVSRDVKAVEKQIEEDKTISLGKQRIILQAREKLQELAQLDFRKVKVIPSADGPVFQYGAFDVGLFIKASKEHREWLRFIAEIEGHLKVKNETQVQVNVLNQVQALPPTLLEQIAGMDDDAQVMRLLEQEFGVEGAQRAMQVLAGQA